MTNLNIKIVVRTMANNKLMFVIKVLSLSVALSASFLILLYCFEELGYDKFHQNKDNIYRVVCKIYENGKVISESAPIPAPVGAMIHDKIPGIVNFSRISIPNNDYAYKYKDNYIHEYGCWADTAFLHIFSIPIISGDKGILKPNTLLISEKLAKKYFGKENPVGKIVNNYGGSSNGEPCIISGVFRLPENTHFNLNTIQSEDLFIKNRNLEWTTYRHTYILLRHHANVKEVESKISRVVEDNSGEILKKINIRYEFKLQKLEDIYLHSNLKNEAKVNGDANLIKALLFLAISIIIIAWINYINLTIAQSLEKAKGTGIRIVHGASKAEICIQTLTESIGINMMALFFASIIIMIAFPTLNHFVGKDLLQGMSLYFVITYAGIFCLGTILSGLYPSLILTSLNNSDILQGKFKYSRKGIISRKIFLGFQFSASIAIIMLTLFVYKQIDFMKSYNRGFNPDQVICIDNIYLTKDNVNKESFKYELLTFPQILKVTKAKTLPGNDVYLKEVIKRSDSNDSFNKIFDVIVADEDYIDVFQFKIIAGRKYSKEFPTDKQGVILNEEAVKYLNYNSPADALDKEIEYRGKPYKILGVIKNFNQLSLKYSIQPFAYFLGSQGFYAIRVKTANMKECLSIIDKTTKKYFEGSFEYYFVDDFYNQQYQNEIKFSQLFTLFSFVLVLITSFGLFGLAMYLSQQRRKEMAMHIINGARRKKIFWLMTSYYMPIIAVSYIVVCPLVSYGMNKWLQNFAYKTELSWWVFALAGIVAVAVAVITVSWQSWRSATRNPVESLRYE